MHTKQKILQISKSRLLTLGFAIFINVLLAGSVCGTFAWYTYATRTGFEKEYHGTTVGELGSLQAGIVSEVQLPEFASYELEEDAETLASEGKYIYWCEEVIQADTINYVISNNGSATTRLTPVTSASYNDFDNPDNFRLYKEPTPGSNYIVDDPSSYAKSNQYVYIPLVLRYEDELNLGSYLPNLDIHITECNIGTSMDNKELYKAVRVYTNNGNRGYIINPSASQDDVNYVGGVLDLNHDGFYDYDDTGHEVVYGEAVTSHYLDEPTPEDQTIPKAQRSTFNAGHKRGTYQIDQDNFVARSVAYHRLSKFTNKEVAVTTTDSNYYNMAKLGITIYVEGWDSHVTDQEYNSGFNIDFIFEVDV